MSAPPASKLISAEESSVISPAPVEASETPPVPELITTPVAPVTLPTVIVLAAPPVPTFILKASASLPILIIPPDEFNSRIPSESSNNVSSESIVISPVPVDAKAIPPVPEFNAIEVAPVTLPIIITSANSPFPILIDLSPCAPILIAWSLSSLPILIAPAEEFNSRTPSASKSNVSSELIVISPFLLKLELYFQFLM